MTARPPAAAPSISTREDLLALGKTNATWTFLGYAAAALAQAPGDEAIRWLVALHLAKLGLGQASQDHLALLSSETAKLPEVQMTQRLAAAVGSGVVPEGSILRRVPKLLEALPDSLARELTPGVPALRELLKTHEVMLPRRVQASGGEAASDAQGVDVRGCIIRPKASTDLLTWTGGFDAMELAREWAQSRAGKQAQTGVIVVGLCPPQPALAVAGQSAAQGGTQQAGTPLGSITILEPDAARALLGLALLEDCSPMLQAHVRVLAGPSAGERYATLLATKVTQGGMLPSALLSLPRADTTPFARDLSARVQQAHDTQVAATRALVARVHTRAKDRDEAWRQARWEQALREGSEEPLRVLLATTRYSTFVQYSTMDLAESFEQLGCRTQVLIEPEPGDQLTGQSYAQALDAFDPDLLVMVNYTRAHVEQLVPPSLPMLTLVQDALPNLLDAATARTQQAIDVLAGVRLTELVRTFGYPSQGVLPAPVPVSPRKFFKASPASERRWDVLLATHHSAPPEVLHAELVAQQRTPAEREALHALLPVCTHLARTQPYGIKAQLHTAVRETLARLASIEPDRVPASAISSLVHGYCMRMCDRILRHDTLGWAIAVAQRHDLRLALVGNGWDEHERFRRYAQPSVQHGPALRELYASSACCLHASMHGVLHQRVFECAMTGGLPLCRNTINAAWPAFTHARALVAGALAGTPTQPLAAGEGWRVRPHAWPMLADAIELITRLGLPREAVVGEDGLAQVLCSHAHERDVDEVASGIILPASETFFASQAQLETLVLRATSDRAWRERTSDAIASACAETVTTDALVARVLAHMQVQFAHVRECEEAAVGG